MDRRREYRIPVELPGRLRIDVEPAQAIWYSQISAHGCRLTGMKAGLASGSEVEIDFGLIEAGKATVRWTRGNAVGVQFHEPLDLALVDYFRVYLSEAA